MIKFPCQCGFEFEVPAEMAGNPLQCPRCMRLNDVPLLSDLAQLEGDGTIRLEPVPLEEDGKREAELKRAYMPRRHTEEGDEYDLRPTFEEVVEAGADEIPLDMRDEVRPGAPKYDPVSGELIKPLSVRGEEAQAVIPLPAGPPTLHYEKHPEGSAKTAMWKAPILMFTPGSAAVLIMIFAVNLVTLAIWVPIGGGLFFAAFVNFFLYMGLIAHHSNIVEEVGPWERDDLPTPLRGVGYYDDIWLPYWNFLVASALCYWPGFLVLYSREMWLKAGQVATLSTSLTLFVLGTFFFPVVFLTTVTSGTYVNLRPDRVLGTIGAIGGKYILIVSLWVVAAGTYLLGTREAILHLARIMGTGVWIMPRPQIPLGICIGLIAAGVYLLHIFCWVLGLCYRHYHANFPWAMQKHVSTRRIQRRIVKHRPIPVAAKGGPEAPVEAPPRLRVKTIRE